MFNFDKNLVNIKSANFLNNQLCTNVYLQVNFCFFSARLAVKDPGGRPDSRHNKSGRRHKESSKLSDSLRLNKSMEKGSNHSDKSKSTKADKRVSARSRR